MEYNQQLEAKYSDFFQYVTDFVNAHTPELKEDLRLLRMYPAELFLKYLDMANFTDHLFTVWRTFNDTYLRYINIFVPTKEIVDKFYELRELLGKEILKYYPAYANDMQRLSDFKKLVLEFERTPEKDRSLYSKIFGQCYIPYKICSDKRLEENCTPLPEDTYGKVFGFLLYLQGPVVKFKREQEEKEKREQWKLYIEEAKKKKKLEERRDLQSVEIEPYHNDFDGPIRRLYQPLV